MNAERARGRRLGWTMMAALALMATLAGAMPGRAAAPAPRPPAAELAALAAAWDRANFGLADDDAEARAAAAVGRDAEALAARYPGRAEPLFFEGLARATEADARGGPAGLRLARTARDLLEQALRIDPDAMGRGVVDTALGALYAQAPPFPLSFGDTRKARAHLVRALAADPNGAEANYYYGDLLWRAGDAAGAEAALGRVLAAPPRPGREVADRALRVRAAELIGRIRRGRR